MGTTLLVLAALLAAPKSPEEIFRAPIVAPVPKAKVTVTAGGEYGSADASQRADVYRPAGKKKVGAVVFIHGGFPEIPGLHGRESGQYTSWARLLAASGLAAVTFDHRLRVGAQGAMHVDEAAADLKALLAWLRAHAAEHAIDPDRVCLFAVSAGGPLLATAFTGMRCLVDYYGFTDVDGVDLFAKAEGALSLVDQAGSLPPVLIARAGKDQVPQIKESIDRFVTEALSADAEFTLHDHAQGPHAFDVLDDSPRSREIIEATVSFLRARLRER